jgi:hypothetical protein
MGTITFILILAVIFGLTIFLTNRDHKKRIPDEPTIPIMASNEFYVIIKDGLVRIYNKNGYIGQRSFYEYVKQKNNIENVKAEFQNYYNNHYIYLEKGNYHIFVYDWDKISHCKTAEEVIPVLQKMEKEIVDWYNSIPQETKTIKI